MTCRIASCYASHCWRYHSEVASHAPCRQRCCQQHPVLPATSPAILRVASKVASNVANDVASNTPDRQQRCQRFFVSPVMSPATPRIASNIASDIFDRQRHRQRHCMLLAITLSIAGNVQGFATTLQNDQKGCGTNFLIIMYGDEW